MSNAVLFIPFSPLLLVSFLSHPGKGQKRGLVTGALPVFERDAYTLAAQTQFYTLLLSREIDDHSMLVAHGLDSVPAPHRHIRIGSHIEAIKVGRPAEIVDRALSVELRYMTRAKSCP
jgi:hypothetical protein